MATLTYRSNISGELRTFNSDKLCKDDWERLCRDVQRLDVAVWITGSKVADENS